MTTLATHVVDVNEQTFITEVLERSQSVPVVVDFWAEWCGPCRMLGPTLERLAEEYDGEFVLAKVNVDESPNLSQQFGIQGIPAVKAFKKNQVVNEFTGALPEPEVRKFLETLIPSPADIATQEANVLAAHGDTAQAIEKYQAALAIKVDYFPAKLGLGRTLLEDDQLDDGIAILESIPAGAPEGPVAEALLATVRFQRHADGQTIEELQAKITANPNDVPSRYALANILAAQEDYETALDEFLEVVRRDRTHDDDGARKAILALLTTLGDDHPLTSPYRQKLAMALF